MEKKMSNEYDLDNLVKVTTRRFGFELFTPPQIQWKYTDIVFEEMSALLMRQNAKGVNTLVDVGAHNGFYDVLVGLSNPDCKIFAFEPVPENVEVIKKNLALHGLKASLHNLAVSDQPGRLSFQVSEATSQSGFIANPDMPVIGNIDVDVVTVDQFIDQIPAGPVLVKIDTEGSEIKVLDGMRNLIARCDDIRLLVEVNPSCLEANGTSARALLNHIDQLGFDIFVVFDMEMRYVKFVPGSDWNEYMGTRTYRNVFCVKKKRSLHVCVFNHSSGKYGAELSLLELIDRLAARQAVLFTLVIPADGVLRQRTEDLGGSVMVVQSHWWCAVDPPESAIISEMILNSYENIENLSLLLKRIAPDVILSNSMVSPWGAVSALLLNRPHIWWVKEFGQSDHNLDFYFTFQKTLEVINEASNSVVTNSAAVKHALFPALGPEKCQVASNIVSLPPSLAYDQPYFRHASSIKLIIAAGNVIRQKGQADAVHAVIKLIKNNRDVELCLVGRIYSYFGDSLQALVKLEGLEDRIHFLGYLDNIRPVLEQADIYLMCSEMEAFGRVTVEAMMLGLPVIATNTGGTVELMEDGKNGLLYSPGDVSALVDRIEYFIAQPGKIKEFGQYASVRILQKLAEQPADVVLLDQFMKLKNSFNPRSAQLLQLILLWQTEVKQRYQAIVQLKQQEIQALQQQAAEYQQAINSLLAQAQTSAPAPDLSIMPAPQGKPESLLGQIAHLLSSPWRMARNNKAKKDLTLLDSTGLFDAAWYLETYPDVARSGLVPGMHFLLYGALEGRDPGPGFSCQEYYQAHPGLKERGINALLHSLRANH